MHYLLSSPFLRLFRPNSRSLNLLLHQVLGPLILLFLTAHISLYTLLFIQLGIFWNSIRQTKIVVGVLSAVMFLAVGVSSMGWFRRRWYTWWWWIHALGSGAVLGLLLWHLRFVRVYLFESTVVVGLNGLMRFWRVWEGRLRR